MIKGVQNQKKTLNTISANLNKRPRLTYYKTKKPLRNIDNNISYDDSLNQEKNLSEKKNSNDNLKKEKTTPKTEQTLDKNENLASNNQNNKLNNIVTAEVIKLNSGIKITHTNPLILNDGYNINNIIVTENPKSNYNSNFNNYNYNTNINPQIYPSPIINAVNEKTYDNNNNNYIINQNIDLPILSSPNIKQQRQLNPLRKNLNELIYSSNTADIKERNNNYQNKYKIFSTDNRYALNNNLIPNSYTNYGKDYNYQIIEQTNLYSTNNINYDINQNLNNNYINMNEQIISTDTNTNLNNINTYINDIDIYNQEIISTPIKNKNNIKDIYGEFSSTPNNNSVQIYSAHINEINNTPIRNENEGDLLEEYISSPKKKDTQQSLRLTQTFHNYIDNTTEPFISPSSTPIKSPTTDNIFANNNLTQPRNIGINYIPKVAKNLFGKGISIKNFHCLSKAGSGEDGIPKTNQDSYISLTNINNIQDFNIFAVLDGHGPHGHLVSKFVSKVLPKKILSHPSIKSTQDLETIYYILKQNNFAIIKQAFLSTDNQIKTCNFDVRDSGTTCVLIIIIGIHLICANIGDSRAIAVYDENCDKNLNYLKVMPLSKDFKPELQEERDRIIMAGGVVEQLKNFRGVGTGPQRVFKPGKDYPGLAMSRSIGDAIAKTLGVIAEPGIFEYNLSSKDKFIILCSDGVWEFLSNEDVKNIGKKFYLNSYPVELCEELYSDSLLKWQCNDTIVDDITVIAIYF